MDQFENHITGLESPATRLFEITPSDASPLALATRAICVETDGFVRVTTVGGDTGRVFIPAGVPFPLRATHVLATGTTATGITGLA
ncbi:hypothetical protein P6F26_14430 [Roseibacterium sp. SDUM158017]|uniref:spike base protein, RCAP_Rcc01079 family n=1 Tax=Roseicyclus salinarum TaxID=3036773 RepID=UPI0024150897|nr:hypothetical protein [Roseibacterium sp. SDUM158017]MDG4649638.1 hypothetical protein [Roseibacterium sp. SDUM158017]